MRTPPGYRAFSIVPGLILTLAALGSPRTALAQAPTAGKLFQDGKSAFKLASYRLSLDMFRRLEELVSQPGYDETREKLGPLIAFYRGANHAALGEKETARLEFAAYLESFPAAHLDPAAFPKSVLEVFAAVKEQAGSGEKAARRRPSEESPIAAEYARFRPDPGHPRAADEKWAESALRLLMSRRERAEWDTSPDPERRAEFIAAFWRRRDPNPLTPENELREELERRLAFADARFTIGEKAGSASDRGMVFVLLGPPSYIGQAPLKSQDDSVQAARAAPLRVLSTASRRATVQLVPRDPLSTEVIQGTREFWHYNRDRLPRAVRFSELDLEFTTKKGYGNAVLERDQVALLALEAGATALAPKE